MSTWQQFSEDAPELATAVRSRLQAAKHHVLATLRRDGSPRVSGSEVDFYGPDLVIGSMWEARKARDLQRDGRFALHAHPGDDTMAGGDAKVAGVAAEVVDEAELAAFTEARQVPPPFHLFRLDLTEVVLTSVHPDGDRLVIERWCPGQPVSRAERR